MKLAATCFVICSALAVLLFTENASALSTQDKDSLKTQLKNAGVRSEVIGKIQSHPPKKLATSVKEIHGIMSPAGANEDEIHRVEEAAKMMGME